MNLHEYQAKELFAEFGLPVAEFEVIRSLDEAMNARSILDSERLVVKAQVHAGGRGKGGGVKLTNDVKEYTDAVSGLIGTRLVTYQTDENGQPVNELLIERPCDIATELYLGAVIDRSSQRLVIMASTEGGVEIEKVAHDTPEKILKIEVNPLVDALPYQGRQLAFQLGLEGKQIKQFVNIVIALSKMFVACDLNLVEINPLVITGEGDLLCLDAKVALDENAMYRQKKLSEKRDVSQEDARENHAREWDLNYVSLDGDIGCMVNGAGLAMATMDMVKLCNGEPANFLDVGGGATKERVAEAFKIILSDDKVKGILVNIFGGIVRCDMIASGIIDAVKEVGVEVPVVVRLEGNNAESGATMLKESGLNLTPASDLKDAAVKIVKAVGEKA